MIEFGIRHSVMLEIKIDSNPAVTFLVGHTMDGSISAMWSLCELSAVSGTVSS